MPNTKTIKKVKKIKAWAVICNKEGFILAHWNFAAAHQQLKRIREEILHEGERKCIHKVVPVEITLKSN